MTEHEDEKGLEITFQTDNGRIRFHIKNSAEFAKRNEELFRIADQFDKLNNIFLLRKKYSDLFTILPKGLLIHWNEDKWKDWEKTMLILLLNHPYPTERQAIWDCDIDSNNLRQIIHQKSEFIVVLQDNKLALTTEGLVIILEKLNSELANYRNNFVGENTDE